MHVKAQMATTTIYYFHNSNLNIIKDILRTVDSLYLELLSISNKVLGPLRVRDRESPLYLAILDQYTNKMQ